MAKRLFACGLIMMPMLAQAAEPRLQDATISGNGSTITINNMPVQTEHGMIYRDVKIVLRVDENGVVSFAPAPGKPADSMPRPIVQAPAAPPAVQHFREGSYVSADGTLMSLTSDKTLIEGVPYWKFSALSGTPGAIGEATWYEGPIVANPKAGAIRRAGITSMAYSYGITTNGSGSFEAGALIGATETDDNLIIVSFRRGCCGNGAKPTVAQVYTRK